MQTLQYGSGKYTINRSGRQNIEDIFFKALSRASLCRDHGRQYTTHVSACTSRKTVSASARKPRPRSPHQVASFGTYTPRKESAEAIAAATYDLSREELKSLVDVYQSFEDEFGESDTQSREPLTPTDQDVLDYPEHPEPAVSDEDKMDPWRTRRLRRPDNDEVAATYFRLTQLISEESSSAEEIFQVYQALPSPRMKYLRARLIRELIRRVRSVEFKTQNNMLRYFTLMDDLVAAGLPLSKEYWNVSISYAGRWSKIVQDEHVESAMRMWIRMEREGDNKADNVTFNTLFDIATKAEKFALGEVILKEIEARSMDQTLFLRTSKIIYYGKKMDGEGVRQSYKELVDAGEFVSTYVLNCVISGLIRAGEASAAEQVFERMKQMDAEKTGRRPNPTDWREKRRLANLLVRASREYRDLPEQRAAIQATSPVAPSLDTYRLLVRYHANDSGNIDRVSELMQDMRAYDLPLHGTIFFQVFRGFSIHGGVRYSSWTRSRLDRLWKLFLIQVEQYREVNENLTEAVSDIERGCYIEHGVVVQALLAYIKCAKQEDVMEVWESILDRWAPNDDDKASINGLLATHLDMNISDESEIDQ